MSDSKNKVFSIEGGKKTKKSSERSDTAKLFVGGEMIELESFILSGQNQEGKRILYTWNSSLDEMISYVKMADVLVHERSKETLGY